MSYILQQFLNFIAEVDSSYQMDSIDSLTMAIQVLDELLDTHPKVIAKSIDKLLDIQTFLLQHIKEVNLLDVAQLYDFEVGVVSKYPKLLSRKLRCQKLLRGSIDILSQISDEVTNEWMDPPEGMSEDDLYACDVDMQSSRQVMSSFDSLAEILSEKSDLGQFQIIFEEYVGKTDNWRTQFAALIVASQLGEVVKKFQDLATFINWGIILLDHNHPKIRYAALQLLGQLSDDRKPDFQQKYFDVLMPKLIKLLEDPVPRVVSHTLACLTNFFEDFHEIWRIQSCLVHLLNPIFNCLNNGKNWLKQNSLSVLAALCGVKDAFGPNITQVFQTLNSVIATYSQIPNSTQIMNQSFQTITILLSSQNKDYIRQYIPHYVSLLINNRDKLDLQYFVSGWSRLCKQYESFTDISLIYPYLLQKIQQSLINDTQETTVQVLNCFVFTSQSFKLNVHPYTQQTLAIAKQIFSKKDLSDNIREQSIELISKFIINIKSQTPVIFQEWIQTAYQTIKYYLDCIDSVFANQNGCFEELEWLLSGIKQIIVQIKNSLGQVELKQILDKLSLYQTQIEEAYKKVLTQKQSNKVQEDDQQIGEEDEMVKLIQYDIANLVNGLQSIPIIIGELLKIANPKIKQSLINHLTTQIQVYLLKQYDDFKHYSLSIAITLIQTCNYQEISSIWGQAVQLLQHYSSDSYTRIRNASIYGMGVIFMKTPLSCAGETDVINWLQMLWASIQTPYIKGCDKKGEVEHCNDNVVSALGKLLKFWGPTYPHLLNQNIYKKWCSSLPLNFDKEEGDIQQQYLIELLDQNPNLIIQNAADLKQICQIYAKFAAKRQKPKYQKITKATKDSLLKIKQWPLFVQSSSYLWNSLSASEINSLTKLMGS